MFELIGLIFGGASRLFQHFLDMKDKQAEREHEAVMFDKQIALADRKYEQDVTLRKMDAESAETAGDFTALTAAFQDQAQEAAAAGGWVAKLSASVRPVMTYWFMGIYSASKVVTMTMAFDKGVGFSAAFAAAYTAFDGAIFASVVSFYFADRALRKRFGA